MGLGLKRIQASKQLGHLVACTKFVSGMQGFFDLFTTTTGERGDFPVIPDAVGTEQRFIDELLVVHTKWMTKGFRKLTY